MTEIEIPEGKRAEWVNGVLTLVDDIKYKYQVGDKVKSEGGQTYTITGQFAMDGEPWYGLTNGDGKSASAENWLMLIPQDIIERIKTFEDACEWCIQHEKANLVYHFVSWGCYLSDTDDVRAYLKLRIITAALNERWEPSEKEDGIAYAYVPKFKDEKLHSIPIGIGVYGDSSAKLSFKSEFLAAYAATQFADIYRDFCGCKKGDEKCQTATGYFKPLDGDFQKVIDDNFWKLATDGQIEKGDAK